jgi:biotin synthase
MKVCSGGIVGMGEGEQDRVGLLLQLANMPVHPESVPINMLVRVEGTPLEDIPDFDAFDFIRSVAVARILMPASHVRLSAGREEMNEQMQAMAFMAGANSIFYGGKLLTTANPEANKDMQLFKRLGIEPEPYSAVENRRDNTVEMYEPKSAPVPESALFYNVAN